MKFILIISSIVYLSLSNIYCFAEETKQNESIFQISKEYIESSNFLYLGRGYQFPVALEGALKLKEISYIHAEGYPAAEMKHGPIALIDKDMPVVFIVTNTSYNKVLSNIQEVKARKGIIITITDRPNKEQSSIAEFILEVPKTHPYVFPITSSIVLH